MNRNDPFGSDNSDVSAQAEVRISVDSIVDGEATFTVHAAAPGLPVLKLSENRLREGDTLTLRDIEITLKINVTK
jgi:hypothetical protein